MAEWVLIILMTSYAGSIGTVPGLKSLAACEKAMDEFVARGKRYYGDKSAAYGWPKTACVER